MLKQALALFMLLAPMQSAIAQDDALADLLTKRQDYIALPLQAMPTGQLQLAMTVNRVEGMFILDTGATATTLDINVKRKFRLQSERFGGVVAGAGGAGMPLEKTSRPVRIDIGTLRLDDRDIYLADLDHVNGALGEQGIDPVDGVIGADLLDALDAVIDYRAQVLYLHPMP